MNMSNHKPSIVFMGTPHFAAHILATLIDKQYKLTAVVTVADKAAGRGKKIKESAVKQLAIAHHIPCLQPTNLKDPEFVSQLEQLKADIFVVVAFRMLPEVVWTMPKQGTFNLHASLLPQYRGAAPINWALINGEQKTGVSTFFIDQKIDTGAIIDQQEVAIEKEETAGSLHDKLMEAGSVLVCKTIDAIAAGAISSKPQKTTAPLKEAPKIFKEDCKIDWSKPGSSIQNLIRGLSPYPGAWCYFHNQGDPLILKIANGFFEETIHNDKINSLIKSKKELKVALQDGYMHLTEIQLPGKRMMKVQELLNGLSLKENAYVS